MPSFWKRLWSALKTPLDETASGFLRRQDGKDGRSCCPVCGGECSNIKVRVITKYTCLIAAASWQEMRLTGCPACLRHELKKHLFWSVFSANILWPFLVLPSVLWKFRGIDAPGHDPAWLALVDSIEEIEEDIARESTEVLPPPGENSLPAAIHGDAEQYRPVNGRFGWKTAAALLVWAAILPGFCLLYAWVCVNSPWLIIGPVLLCAFAGIHGGLIAWFARLAGCRSEWGLRLVALLLGVWALYLSWVFWLYVVNDYWIMVWNPYRIGRAILFICGEGFWAMGDRVIGQKEQLIYWIAEAAVMLLLPLSIVWNSIRKHPFCGVCGKAFSPLFFLRKLEQPASLRDFRKAMEAGRFELLDNWPLRRGGNYLDVAVLHCENCRNDYLLRIQLCMQQQPGTEKKEGGIRITVIPPLYCSAGTVERLQRRSR